MNKNKTQKLIAEKVSLQNKH